MRKIFENFRQIKPNLTHDESRADRRKIFENFGSIKPNLTHNESEVDRKKNKCMSERKINKVNEKLF